MKRAYVLAGTASLVAGLFLLAGPAFAQSYVDGLIVEKQVLGDAPEDAEFEFDVECTLLGDVAVQDTFVLGDGENHNVSPVPPGATCTVTESVPDGSEIEDDDFVTSFVVTPEAALNSTSGRTVEVTLPEDEVADFTSIEILAINDFGEEEVLGSGELVVTKRVDGDSDAEWEFEVDCPGAVQDTVSLGDGESATFTITRGIGTTCTITEVDPDGYDVSHRIDGGDAESGVEASFEFDDEDVDIELDLVREVEFTNTPEEETAVLADTGFEVSWGLLLAAGLILPGAGAVLYARRRESGSA